MSNDKKCLYLDLDRSLEYELDKEYNMSQFKTIMFDSDDNQIYLIANVCNDKLGFFVIKISSKNIKDHMYLIKWKKKLDIGDAKICILNDRKKKLKEIIISYKTIYINVYNILVLDLNHKS